MTLKDVLYTVQFFYDKKTNKTLDVDQFNRLLQFANNELKKTIYGRIGEKDGYETEQQISDALKPFKTTSTISINSSGIGNLPTDYWHKIRFYTASGIKIDVVTSNEFERRTNCSIDTPSTIHPIIEIINTTVNYNPASETTISIVYLKHDTPQINFTYTKGYPEYTTSTELLWGQDKYIDIIRLILGYLNIPIDNSQVLSYVEAKTDKEN